MSNIETKEKELTISAREKIMEMERLIATLPNAEIGNASFAPLRHSFAKGCYVREMFMPKGTLASGKIHRNDHPMFILKGKLGLYTEKEGLHKVEGPCYFISKAGAKRVGYAYEDTVLVEVHVTDETDLEKIENEVIVKSFEEFDRLIN